MTPAIDDTPFLDFLREARAQEGRGNEELLRAILPLLEQLQAVHDLGRTAPLNGVERIFESRGALWFHADEAREPTDESAAVRKVQRVRNDALSLRDGGEMHLDIDTGRVSVEANVSADDLEARGPCFVAGYSSWEQELGHHDALTDVFCVGMLFASLAVGADFTEPDELQRFTAERHRLTRMNDRLHPVLARAIVRMTEPDRHKRVQDLPGLIERLRHYRDVDDRVDASLDFTAIDGFVTADRSSRRHMIQDVLQARLFDTSRRNRLIYFKTTQQMLDLTMASVPTQLALDTIRAEDLFLWDGSAGEAIRSGKPLRLDRYLRFEEAPWVKGTLDKARSEDRRSRTEVGFSQLRLVIAFLNWHNLKDNEDERVRSPLLLLPVTMTLQRGVRNSYVLQAQTQMAEVNPVLRHHLQQVYDLELPDHIDLEKSDVETFHKVLAAAIARSEPGVSLHLITRPQIQTLRETARRRTDVWRRRRRATGRGLKSELGVDYSYNKSNFKPLGLQLYRQYVAPEVFDLEEHLKTATPTTGLPMGVERAPDEEVETTSRNVYQHAEEASGPYDWAVDLTHCTLGNFNYRKMSLVRDYDRMMAESADREHPGFDTLFSLDARPVAAPPEEAQALDLFTVVPADPSQAAAVQWARSGKSFIIQGPPGTGKSQTITNLIADFAARGKRVLFVCQKRAALDVVYHRLAQHDLDELSVIIHDALGDKKGFIADLKDVYTDWTRPDQPVSIEPRRQEVLSSLHDPLDAMQRFASGMTGAIHTGTEPIINVVSAQVSGSEVPSLSPSAAKSVPGHGEWTNDRDAVYDACNALSQAGESPVIAHLALRHLAAGVLDAPKPADALQAGLDRIGGLINTVAAASEHVRDGATTEDLSEALALADELAALLPNNLALLDAASSASADLNALVAEQDAAERALTAAQAAAAHWKDPLSVDDTRTALAQAQRFDALFILFCWLTPAWWTLRGLLQRRYDYRKHAVKPPSSVILQRLADVHTAEADATAVAGRVSERFGIEATARTLRDQVDALRNPPGRSTLQRELVQRWSQHPQSAHAIIDARHAIDALKVEADAVFDGGSTLSFEALSERVRDTRAASDLLPSVLGPLRRLHQASPTVREAVRTVPLTPKQWDSAVNQRALDTTWAADRPLARFDAGSLRERQVQLSHRYTELLALNAAVIRERVRSRFHEQLRISSLTANELSADEKALKKAYTAGRRVLEREFEKVMRHKSIRELSEGDTGTVVYDLKPIWLMSPLSISDTIPLEEQRFDVVIFDEASQIPLEEAIPAVYRAPQMIVVGDEMQLPPTTFFASKSADDTDMSDAVAQVHYDLDADSFLSHSARCLSSTMLQWHYRSRHEALIQFSNQAFYAGDLLTVPDRVRSVERDPIVVTSKDDADTNAAFVTDRPVSFHRLQASPYTNRQNVGEAEYIARVVRQLLRNEDHTIGIVAFSEAQQGEIEAALERLASTDSVFQRELDAAIEREDDGQYTGLFVKNLENVQGDERDIIILSVCYGPDKTGKMRMNFGPINKGGGEKRLNVVFSRAKRHMAVVSSIEHTAITNQYNDGALCLRRYLQFADAASRGDDGTLANIARALGRERGASVQRAARNAVAEALADKLEDAGLVVVRDVGSSDFTVDLAAGRDDEDALAVAILIDSPEHYAGFDPFTAVHVRPSVLRAFDWTVVHVLSKEWLANPEDTLARVLRAVEDPSTAALPPPPDVTIEPERVEPPPPEAPAEGDIVIAGSTIVITGSLTGMTRSEAEQQVRARGGRVATAVTKRTRFVVVGARPGSKLADANARGIPIVSQDAFLAALAATPVDAIP